MEIYELNYEQTLAELSKSLAGVSRFGQDEIRYWLYFLQRKKMKREPKIVVWFLGSNASGKTSQARMLHESLGNGEKQIHSSAIGETSWWTTTFGDTIAHVGKVGDNACTGTDTLNKKAQIIQSYHQATTLSQIVIIDGIMATGTWIDFILEAKCRIFPVVVLLDYHSLEANLHRLRARRAKKMNIDPREISFAEKTLENVDGKIRSFRSIFNRVSPKAFRALHLNAADTMEDIHSTVLGAILEGLDEIEILKEKRKNLKRK